MPTLPIGHPFRKHSENLRAVCAGLTQAERAHKAAIRGGDAAATDFAARMHQLMIGLLAEAHLRKIISDPGGFNAKERQLLSQERSKIDQWLRTVEFAFRRHYNVPLHREIDETTTAVGIPSQYNSIRILLKDDLEPIIQDRNKVAHAQWRWLLNSKETDFTEKSRPPLNYLALQRRGEIISALAELIHILVVSEPTFHRDYAALYGSITHVRPQVNGRDYPDLVAFLRSRRRLYEGRSASHGVDSGVRASIQDVLISAM
jgi:hypothetical protein